MSTLAQLVQQIVELSSTEATLNTLSNNLKLASTDAALRQNVGGILTDNAIQSLSYRHHSLGLVYLLEAKGRSINTAQAGDNTFLRTACAFLLDCDADQIRRAPLKLVTLCRQIHTNAIALNKPKQAILPLKTALIKLCQDDKVLTPIHACLFELCIRTKCYTAVAALLDNDVTSVDPERTGCTATDVLLYCYYGGMIATALRKYPRALYLFQMAITAPTMVVNAITVAALQKWYLVTLFYTGELPVLPKYTSQVVGRALKSDCGVYTELAKLVSDSTSSQQQLTTFALDKQDVFQADGNIGLVRLIVESLSQRKIQRLRATYLTLSLTELAAQAGLASVEQAEQLLVSMVSDKKIHAQIDGTVVRFLDDPESFDSEAAAANIDQLIQEAHATVKELEDVNFKVSCDRAYINKTDLKLANGGGSKMRMDPDLAMVEDMDGMRADSFLPS